MNESILISLPETNKSTCTYDQNKYEFESILFESINIQLVIC